MNYKDGLRVVVNPTGTQIPTQEGGEITNKSEAYFSGGNVCSHFQLVLRNHIGWNQKVWVQNSIFLPVPSNAE